ncbi:class I SAM-dependent methyltransferase [Candidatus Mycobacterium wuenschmannii]|uniref:Class I SAM-dependent methyltransferase n=1 Tax=Candidatus Mycobacterium wuenschmannii TaxID=3027808 RepID=A0ABY8W121_9MYCO|nr:class I SAM-dependent methyltransferase [Candidatus Mycobacterium wuenschmannii]WIM88709.1 class I SAM-dependent methyltransferase [Candidatus Mycobacterium wuenschmannii]
MLAPLKFWGRSRSPLLAGLPRRLPAAPRKAEIEAIAETTNAIGAQPLAPEYDLPDRFSPADVRSPSSQGDLYAYLVAERDPDVVVEFGSAFGVSGMYFATALRRGRLYSFEINPDWADIAERNIGTITDRFSLIRGAFEEHVDDLPGPIDIALVDGIHDYDFVMRQWELLKPRMSPGGLVLFDDITYCDGMRAAWREIRADQMVADSVARWHRLGIVELTAA